MATGATNNMHNLTTLIKRLEAATSRLEDIASSVDATATNSVPTASASTVVAPDNAAHTATPTIVAAPTEPLPRSIEDFDKLIDEEVTQFVNNAAKVGGLVDEQAKAVLQAYKAERTYLLVATKAKKPEPQPPELMTELHRYTSTVDELREANRPSPQFTHLSAVAEGIVALGWIVERRPSDFVKDILGSSQYYGNKILKEYKDKDKSHVEYISSYFKILHALTAYVKEHYAMGLTWNNKDGMDVLEALTQVQAGSTAPTPRASVVTVGGPPPPPPPPPPPMPTVEQLNGAPPPPPPPSGAAKKGGDMSAVFDQLNQGSAVTSGLRKVDKSEMTHKNPSLRASAQVPQRSDSQSSSGRGKSPVPAKKPDHLSKRKPSRKELDGNKWIIENFENTGNEIIEVAAELNQSILISRCTKCVIRVNGKANAIAIDNCAGLSILIGSLVSSLEVIKSPKFAVQVDGVLPTILLDQIDGAQIYLGEESMKSAPEIFTSKSSAINVVLPPKGDEDSKEEALPEQLRSYFRDGKYVTEVVEHAG